MSYQCVLVEDVIRSGPRAFGIAIGGHEGVDVEIPIIVFNTKDCHGKLGPGKRPHDLLLRPFGVDAHEIHVISAVLVRQPCQGADIDVYRILILERHMLFDARRVLRFRIVK